MHLVYQKRQTVNSKFFIIAVFCCLLDLYLIIAGICLTQISWFSSHNSTNHCYRSCYVWKVLKIHHEESAGFTSWCNTGANKYQPFLYEPVWSLKIVSSAHTILSRISHLLLFNQEQKKVKTKEGEKFGIKSHAHWKRFLNFKLAYSVKTGVKKIKRSLNVLWFFAVSISDMI